MISIPDPSLRMREKHEAEALPPPSTPKPPAPSAPCSNPKHTGHPVPSEHTLYTAVRGTT